MSINRRHELRSSFLDCQNCFRIDFPISVMVTITRKKLVGKSTKKSAVVEAIAKANALNLTGNIDYNIDGTKDNVGFVAVTDKFIDNFLLRIIVPEYNTKDGISNLLVGSQNRKIHFSVKKY